MFRWFWCMTVVVAACGDDTSSMGTGIAGLYSVEPGTDCNNRPDFQLTAHANGSLQLISLESVAVSPNGSGGYDGVHVSSTCAQSNQSYIFYHQGHVTPTSATTIHIDEGGAFRRVSPGPDCSDEAA